MIFYRLKTVFHESFSLSRNSLGQIMRTVALLDNDEGAIRSGDLAKHLRSETHLGTNYIRAMPRYAVGTGLLDQDHAFSLFGRNALHFDSILNKKDTQWLMHYHISAPHGPGPEFWSNLVTSFFRTGSEFSRDEVSEVIGSTYQAIEGKALADRSTRSTATVFLGTYLKEEGLGKLGILEAIAPDRYRVLAPEPPSPWALGYALLDYWKAQFGDRLTVNLDALSGNGSLADLFLMGAERLDGMLRALQGEGCVDIYRFAPPYQVVLLRQDLERLLEKIYASYDSA